MWALINPETARPHIIPIDDLVEHTADENCVCGPSDELLVGEQYGDRWAAVHHRLDGKP